MSFSLQNDLISSTVIASDAFHILWPATSAALLAILCGTMAYAIFSDKSEKISSFTFVVLSALVILICRLPSLFYGESSPDESQWLASVIGLRADFYYYFKNFYIYDFGRALTIAPLLALSSSGLAVDFGLAKLTGVMCWFVFIIFYFLSIRDIFGKRAAIISTSVLVAYLATFSAPDYIAYNSETPVAALLCVFFFCFNRSTFENSNKALGLLSGLMLAALLFAKEQSAYIVFVCGLYAVTTYLAGKHYAKAILFVSGGFVCVLVFFAPFILFHKTDEFLFWVYLNHVYMNFAFGQGLGTKIFFLFVKNNAAYFLLPVISIAMILFFRNQREALISCIKNNRVPGLMVLMLYLASLYTALSQGFMYIHYSIFLVLPAAYLLAFAVAALSAKETKRILAFYGIVLFLSLALFGLSKQIGDYDHKREAGKFPPHQSELSRVVSLYAKPGDGMIVWGWNCKLFVETGLVRASRYWYTTFLRPSAPENLKSRIIQQYEQDIIAYKPRVIVEYIKGGLIVFTTIKDHPTINRLVEKNYNLVYDTDEARIYVLKDK